jgi:hypothetical protein
MRFTGSIPVVGSIEEKVGGVQQSVGMGVVMGY